MRLFTLLSVFALGFVVVACSEDGDAAAATEYLVTVSFNETVTQDGLDETGDMLREYDEDVDYLIQESFPPTGVARLATNEPDFCSAVTAQLSALPYVESVDCAPPPPTSGNPEEPVSDEPDLYQ